MSAVVCVVSDFGGVLTSPLLHAFARVQRRCGVPPEAFGRALRAVERAEGVHPLFELETGRMSEAAFLAKLESRVSDDLGRDVSLQDFSAHYFAGIRANEELFAYYRELSDRGIRLALLTNNVREWEPRWRAMLPIDDIFELVVDSAFVGMRKPDHEIYELTLEQLGLPAAACAFVDDLERNVIAARQVGMHAVHHIETPATIAALAALLG